MDNQPTLAKETFPLNDPNAQGRGWKQSTTLPEDTIKLYIVLLVQAMSFVSVFSV
jgi:hypothetical protein